jgi:hypothetical protein
MSSAALSASRTPDTARSAESTSHELWYNAMAGVIVAGIGLVVLFGVVAVAILTLPDDATKAQNVIAVSSSAFGVIGTIVGAYFGVRGCRSSLAGGDIIEEPWRSQGHSHGGVTRTPARRGARPTRP